ncbi:hypothetical protein T03_6131 [Trichinella britovi]|uniref:Uncharacterized protein n=1 Tax=Trichinella britovi TaxID=45882 RepID=A0A0V1D001_TRIBR|nr:hypothetical protein T03_6131 [Trichinella britovi]
MSFRYYHYTCECRPRGYLVNQCLEQQSRSALSSFSQYRLQQHVNHKWRLNNMIQFECTKESMRNLLNNW